MDNFIVSARKYRPATFISVVGQAHVTSTLKNAISRNQLAHAYLFCGPRGVGKTTCARIFAKAINCTNPQESEACGECESCRSFNEGRSFNIHELDAASNNSVDDIRTLTEQVRIPPQTGKYSVYIIDEVHMLSQAAFNAFLKTLEEPPAHAVFILATTEKHKIIPTILSRCQIYDFNRIRVEDSVEYLKHIASEEGVTFDDESLNLIAQKADGGMRDALSMFDKAVAFCGKTLEFKEVARTLNVLDYDTYFKITKVISEGDYKSALLIFDEVLREGFSGQTFMAGLNSHFRDLLMCKDPNTAPLLEVTGSLSERYKQQSAETDTAFLFNAISLLSSIDNTFRSATNQRLHVELGLMKLCGPGQKKNDAESDGLTLPELKKEPNPVTTSDNTVKAAEAAAKKPAIPPKQTVREPHEAEAESPRPETSKPERTEPKSATGSDFKGLSGVSINNILKNGISKTQEQGDPEAEAPQSSFTDPDSEQKILAAKEKFIQTLSRQRPRFAAAFNSMTVSGNKVHATASTELLKEDIVQNQKDIFSLLKKLAGIEGMIELSIEVREESAILRPIKPEDKLAHLREKNPLIDELRRELDLEMD